ncbi:MAG TPA: aldo/keto reductase [Actinomycetota bacterium]
MQTKRLGSNGPDLSVVGYGAWEAGGGPWGPNESDDAVIGAMHAAIDAGINWIDTAEVYGDGVSERLVGRALDGRRDAVVLASKLAPAPEGSGFRPDDVGRGCRASLERLGTDRIDLYQLHWPDEGDIQIEDTWGAMSTLVDEGLVRWIGVSNFDRDLIGRCEAIRHVDSLQPQFNMLDLEQRDLIAWCGERGTGVVSYAPLAFGLLTGAVDRNTVSEISDWRTVGDETIFGDAELTRALPIVDSLRPVAERLDITLAQLALAWNRHQPGVTSAIAGSRNPDHVRSNAAAGDVALDAATLAELDSLIASS